jgi:hypothetical protein
MRTFAKEVAPVAGTGGYSAWFEEQPTVHQFLWRGSYMVKFIRVALIGLAIQGFVLSEASAERSGYCEIALQRCLNECARYPSFIREGCMMGCGISYLNCGT